MKRMIMNIMPVLAVLIILSCSSGDRKEVYIGRIEAETVVVSAQASGELLEVTVSEGDEVAAGDMLGRIDADRLKIQKRQQLAKLNEMASRKEAALLQIDQADTRLRLNSDTLAKTDKLLKEGGATQQKRDELATQVKVNESNLHIMKSNYNMILTQEEELKAGMALTDLAISKATVHSPVKGTVLNRYHNRGELVTTGTPLLKLADLSVMDLYIYLPLRNLPAVKVGQQARVTVSGEDKPYTATVSWISPEGEFTPKTILTKETRDTLVYEVKLRIENSSGELKIGMPADVTF